MSVTSENDSWRLHALTISELTDQFRNAGIEPGDSVLVHSSLRSLGWVDGGAEAVVGSLVDAVGEKGTVLFPTLTGSAADSAETPPVYDARSTECWTGAIPEAARQRPDAVRSLHPTHSVVAIGRLSHWFTSCHELVRTPCGFGSPYDKLADIGGKIMLIGVTQASNTSFHLAEELSRVPYVLQKEPADLTMRNAGGEEVHMQGARLHLWSARRDYDALEPQMIDYGICHIRKVGNAEVRLNDAMLQRMFLVRRLLDDPLAVLDASERVKWA